MYSYLEKDVKKKSDSRLSMNYDNGIVTCRVVHATNKTGSSSDD
jgi:hypothetical protein